MKFGNLFLAISIILFSINTLTAQVRNEAGVIYPDDYKILSPDNLSNLNKPDTDTLDYITLNKIKQDFLVNSGCGDYGADQLFTNAARDDEGNYMCVWIDERTGLRELNAQLFNAADEKVGDVIRVAEQYNQWNSAPNIVYSYASSEYIVTWAESGYDIRLQRLSKQGEKIGSNITVNQIFHTNTNNPSAAVDKFGNILITWYTNSYNFGPSAPYFRILDKNGNAITDQKELLTGNYAVSSSGRETRVASDILGNFIIVWSGHFNNYSQIMMQIVNNNGQLINDNIVVSDPDDSTNNYFPTITSIKDGTYLIIWVSGDSLKGRIYNIYKGFISLPFTIYEESNSWFTYSASSDDQNNFFVNWISYKPYGQIITKQGVFIGENKLIDISTPLTYISFPKLTKVMNGSLYFAYYGYRENDIDVMIQKVDLDFNPLGSSVKIADDYCTAFQTRPINKYNNKGESIVVWNDKRNGTISLYAQVLDKDDNPVSGNILINDTAKYIWTENPDIISDNEGNFIVSFSALEGYSSENLLIQKVSPTGEKIDSNRVIVQGYYQTYKSFMAVNSEDDFLICWHNQNSSYPSAFMKKFNSDLIPYYSAKKFFESTSPKQISDISINKNFNVLTMWVDVNPQTYEKGNVLKGMVFNDLGYSISDTIIVDSLDENRYYLEGRCKINDNENMAFIWSDYFDFGYDFKINIKRFYPADDKTYFNSFSKYNSYSNMQILKFLNKKIFVSWASRENVNSIFLNDNDLSFVPVKLHIFDPFLYMWGEPYNHYSVDIFENKLQLSYESIINPDKGYDIWLNTQLIDQFDFDTVFIPIPKDPIAETVSFAYPNPNPNSSYVKLDYKLTIPVNVIIAVYNILGEKISVIEYGMKEPGTYNIKYNTNELASGIYFLYYEGIKAYVRKFIIIR